MTLPKDPIKREEYLRKLSERGKARFADPEARKAGSERAKAQWADPEARKRRSEQTKAQFEAKNTYLKNKGYMLVRVPEHSIRKGDFTLILDHLT